MKPIMLQGRDSVCWTLDHSARNVAQTIQAGFSLEVFESRPVTGTEDSMRAVINFAHVSMIVEFPAIEAPTRIVGGKVVGG